MTPGNGVSIPVLGGTAILLELKHSCPCLFQHAYSESKVDSPFYQKKSVFQKPWKDVAENNGVMSGTIFNCTLLPNTGFMGWVALLTWLSPGKGQVHSPSWPAISASWTVHPGTKFLHLVYSYPSFLKETPFIPRALQTIFFRTAELKVKNECHLPLSASFYLSPLIHSHCLLLKQGDACLLGMDSFFGCLATYRVSWWLVYLVVPSEGKRIHLWSAVPCGRKRSHWFVQTNYQLEGSFEKVLQFHMQA